MLAPVLYSAALHHSIFSNTPDEELLRSLDALANICVASHGKNTHLQSRERTFHLAEPNSPPNKTQTETGTLLNQALWLRDNHANTEISRPQASKILSVRPVSAMNFFTLIMLFEAAMNVLCMKHSRCKETVIDSNEQILCFARFSKFLFINDYKRRKSYLFQIISQ